MAYRKPRRKLSRHSFRVIRNSTPAFILYTLLLLGSALLFWSVCILWIVPFEQFQYFPTTAVGAVVASCFSVAGAIAVAESVGQRKQRESEAAIREHRENIYESILQHVTASFAGGSNIPEQQIRSILAVWASPEVVKRVGEWNRFVSEVGAAGGAYKVTDESRAKVQGLVVNLAIALREDLENVSISPAKIDEADIGMLLFNDYDPKLRA